MQDLIDFLFGTKTMMLHGYSFDWNPSLLQLFTLPNLATALSYFFVPLAFGIFVYKNKDGSLNWVLLLSVLIFAYGITQALSAIPIWNPLYGQTGTVEAFSTFIPVIAATFLWSQIPKTLRISSSSALLLANKKLEDEIFYHQETKVQFKQLSTELDRLVKLRTTESLRTQELTQKLQETEQYFRSLFEQAPLGIAIIDSLSGNFLDVNQKFIKIIGRTKKEVLNSNWMDITHPDDIQEYTYRIELLNTLKVSFTKTTKRYIRMDNSIVWVTLLSVPINIEMPTQHHLQMIEDASDTRLPDQKNQQLASILENSFNEIYIFNRKTLYFEYVNQGGVNNLGFSLDELKNMTPLDIKPEFDVALFADLIMRLLNGEQNQLHFETIHQRKNGTCYPVEICLQKYRNDSDYFVAICLDISQRKAHEERIKRLNNFYACLSKINHAIVQIDNEADLFAAVCNIAANLQDVELTWIGKPDACSQLFVAVAVAGDCQDFLSNLVVSVDPDIPEGQGPSGLAFRENRIVTVNDFQADPITQHWRDHAEKHFVFGANCAIPVAQNQKPYVILNVYSNQKDFFNEDVLNLMEELRLDLSFALDSYAHEAARRAAEATLELTAKVFSQSREAIVITDKNNNVVSVNRTYTEITGYNEQDIFGKNPRFLASGLHDEDFYRAMWKTLLEDNFWQGELWNRNKNGTVYPEWLTISVVRDEADEIINYIAIFTDITQFKEKEQQIEHLAHYDSLTNLPNRRLLKSRTDHELLAAKRHKKAFTLLFIDLDHFKNINDSLGHSIGDEVLIEVARRLLTCVRKEDTVARFGGDEFNILLPDCNVNGATIVAYKIIASLAEPILYQNYQLYITTSIGISLYPDNGDTYETLFKHADIALYQAKTHGRNQCQFFTKTMQKQTQRRMEIENDLRQAIVRNELTVYFQPQVNTKTGQIIGAEALLRWRHPVWGMVSPVEFIPVAEECGLILSIGDWVLEQSIAQARQWHDAGFPLTIAVNLSLAQFRANTLFEKVKKTLERHQLPAQYLELELTESIAMQHAEVAIEITQQLTQLGIELSIDDFGTGYSSLSYLQRFSLHKLKIDQSFTSGMVNNEDCENIVDAIISLAKSLNLKTIAEGVETKQQLAMFQQKNCDEIQGYYFSKPIPADEFMVLIDKNLFFVPPISG